METKKAPTFYVWALYDLFKVVTKPWAEFSPRPLIPGGLLPSIARCAWRLYLWNKFSSSMGLVGSGNAPNAIGLALFILRLKMTARMYWLTFISHSAAAFRMASISSGVTLTTRFVPASFFIYRFFVLVGLTLKSSFRACPALSPRSSSRPVHNKCY